MMWSVYNNSCLFIRNTLNCMFVLNYISSLSLLNISLVIYNSDANE